MIIVEVVVAVAVVVAAVYSNFIKRVIRSICSIQTE